MRRDEDVDGKDELFAYRPANGIAPFGPVVQGFGDDEEIDVAVGAGVAAGVAKRMICSGSNFWAIN